MSYSTRSIVARYWLRRRKDAVRLSNGELFELELLSCFSAVSLYPHRILSTVGRTCTMPIQTLCTSCDTNYLIGSSTSPETLQLMDSKQLKTISNKKKKKGNQRGDNAFFADLEANGQQDQESYDNSDDDDDSDDDGDEEIRKPPKKKKKKAHS
jgi:hypothetical protein